MSCVGGPLKRLYILSMESDSLSASSPAVEVVFLFPALFPTALPSPLLQVCLWLERDLRPLLFDEDEKAWGNVALWAEELSWFGRLWFEVESSRDDGWCCNSANLYSNKSECLLAAFNISCVWEWYCLTSDGDMNVERGRVQPFGWNDESCAFEEAPDCGEKEEVWGGGERDVACNVGGTLRQKLKIHRWTQKGDPEVLIVWFS